jgi:hypothetical protein
MDDDDFYCDWDDIMTRPDPEHFSEGGTAVTNFSEHMRPVYVEAVKRYGKSFMRVAQHPYGGVPQNYGGALHCDAGFQDLSRFWEIFEQVKADMGLSELSLHR